MSDHDNAHDQDPEIEGTDIEFAEPQLGSAEISADVAASVDLEKVEAEAAEVAREAERSAQLPASEVIGSIPAPTVDLSTPSDPDVDESTVLRTDFTKAPVANNPWTANKPADDAVAPHATPEEAAPSTPNAPAAPPAAAPAVPPVQSPSAPAQPDAGAPSGDPGETTDAGAADENPLADAGAPAAEPLAANATTPAQEPKAAESGNPAETKAAYSGRGIDDGSGWHRPETQWQPRANSWQSPGQVAQGAADAAAFAAAQAEGQPAPAQPAPGQPTPGQPPLAGALGVQPPAGQPPYGAPASPGAQPPYGPPGMRPPAGLPPFGATSTQPVYGAPGQHGAANSTAQSNQGHPGIPPVPPISGYPGGPGQPGGPWQGGPGMPGSPQGPGGPGTPANKNKLFIILGIVVVAIVLLGLLVWLVIGLLSGLGSKVEVGPNPTHVATAQADPTDGTAPSAADDADVIVPQAMSNEWLKGDCLRGFDGTITKPADVVRCSSPHSAQVVDSFEYGVADAFPGADAVKKKAAALCKNAPVTNEAKNYVGLKSFYTFPTSGSWDNGDRTVQCIAVDPTGDKMTSSLVQ